MLVVKPAGLLTVPTPKREKNTLLDNINRWLDRQQRGSEAFSVHRLDRGVSGLLVFGKSLEIALALRSQFQERKPKRIYTAIVAGQIESDSGTFKSYLATDADLNRYSTTDETVGWPLLTINCESNSTMRASSVCDSRQVVAIRFVCTSRKQVIRCSVTRVIARNKPGTDSGPIRAWPCMPSRSRSNTPSAKNRSSS